MTKETGAKTEAKTQLRLHEVCSELDEHKREEQQLAKQRKHMAILRNDHTCRSSNSFNEHFAIPFLTLGQGVHHTARVSAYEISKSTAFYMDFIFQIGFLNFQVDFWILFEFLLFVNLKIQLKYILMNNQLAQMHTEYNVTGTSLVCRAFYVHTY